MPKASTAVQRAETKNVLTIIAIEHIVHFETKSSAFFGSKEHEKPDFKLTVEYDDHTQPIALNELKKFHHGVTRPSLHDEGRRYCEFVFSIHELEKIKKILLADNPDKHLLINAKFQELLHPQEKLILCSY